MAKTLGLILVVLLFFTGCLPTSRLLKEHQYAEAIAETLRKISDNPDDKKAGQKLQQAYQEALTYFQSELNAVNTSNDSLRYTKSLVLMQYVNDLTNSINKNPYALKYISGLKVYTSELAEIKPKAVDELISAGKTLLNKHTPESARHAYSLFKQAYGYQPGTEISLLINEAQKLATCHVVINPVNISFNTLKVTGQKIDKELFYWTQRDVMSRPFIRYYTADDAEKQQLDPDFYVFITVLDYRVDKMAAQGGAAASNLMASGNLQIRIFSSDNQTLVFKKNLSCRYDSETKSTIRVNTIDLQRVVDPDIQTFFDYMVLSGFDRITEEIDNYFSTLVKQ
jgi:hypothetical protein